MAKNNDNKKKTIVDQLLESVKQVSHRCPLTPTSVPIDVLIIVHVFGLCCRHSSVRSGLAVVQSWPLSSTREWSTSAKPSNER